MACVLSFLCNSEGPSHVAQMGTWSMSAPQTRKPVGRYHDSMRKKPPAQAKVEETGYLHNRGVKLTLPMIAAHARHLPVQALSTAFLDHPVPPARWAAPTRSVFYDSSFLKPTWTSVKCGAKSWGQGIIEEDAWPRGGSDEPDLRLPGSWLSPGRWKFIKLQPGDWTESTQEITFLDENHSSFPKLSICNLSITSPKKAPSHEVPVSNFSG